MQSESGGSESQVSSKGKLEDREIAEITVSKADTQNINQDYKEDEIIVSINPNSELMIYILNSVQTILIV